MNGNVKLLNLEDLASPAYHTVWDDLKKKYNNIEGMRNIFRIFEETGGIREDVLNWFRNNHFFEKNSNWNLLNCMAVKMQPAELWDFVYHIYQDHKEEKKKAVFYSSIINSNLSYNVPISVWKKLYQETKSAAEFSYALEGYLSERDNVDQNEDVNKKVIETLEEVQEQAGDILKKSDSYLENAEKVSKILEENSLTDSPKNAAQDNEQTEKNEYYKKKYDEMLIKYSDLKNENNLLKMKGKSSEVEERLNYYKEKFDQESAKSEKLFKENMELKDKIKVLEQTVNVVPNEDKEEPTDSTSDECNDNLSRGPDNESKLPETESLEDIQVIVPVKKLKKKEKIERRLRLVSLISRIIERKKIKHFSKKEEPEKMEIILKTVLNNYDDKKIVKIIRKIIETEKISLDFLYTMVSKKAAIEDFNTLFILIGENGENEEKIDIKEEKVPQKPVVKVQEKENKTVASEFSHAMQSYHGSKPKENDENQENFAFRNQSGMVEKPATGNTMPTFDTSSFDDEGDDDE